MDPMIQSLFIASDDALHCECRGVDVGWDWSAGEGDGGGDGLRCSVQSDVHDAVMGRSDVIVLVRFMVDRMVVTRFLCDRIDRNG